nr:NADH dehydrogenase subunit 5 [Dicyathifer mannii]
MFFVLSVIFFFFYSFVEGGGVMAFEYNLSELSGVPLVLLFYVDWASVMFSMSVLFISGSVLFYCCFYMRGEVYPERFCWLVVLFVVFMNLFIFMPSVLGMMVGWDGLGVVSFALVSYYKNAESLAAGNITVLTGRIGDACLVVLIACSISNMSWHWFDMSFLLGFWVMTCVTVASMTKSAQVPFSAWLPAAMAAPTPVSALVHSSTLVTAGVYVLYRYYGCVYGSWMMYMVFVSLMTMALAGLVASVESDLKKVVAFSTMSQLGVMVMGISAASCKDVGMFHLLVHAFYKSLMFLCVGCVIYKGAGLQDSRFYSGLWFKMPIVGAWLIVACMSLSAIPYTSGFFSKHAVVEGCFNGEATHCITVITSLSVFFTSFYSFRMLGLMFVSYGFVNTCKSVVDKEGQGVGGNLYVFAPLFFLGFAALFVGHILMKCFAFLNGYVFVPSCMKFTINLMNVLGCLMGFWCCFYFNVFSLSNISFSSKKTYILRFVKSHWFLPFLSGNVLASIFLVWGSRMYLFLEKGWLETWFWMNQLERFVESGKVLYASSHHPKIISLVFVFIVFFIVVSYFS